MTVTGSVAGCLLPALSRTQRAARRWSANGSRARKIEAGRWPCCSGTAWWPCRAVPACRLPSPFKIFVLLAGVVGISAASASRSRSRSAARRALPRAGSPGGHIRRAGNGTRARERDVSSRWRPSARLAIGFAVYQLWSKARAEGADQRETMPTLGRSVAIIWRRRK